MMEEQIESFPSQFDWEPEFVRGESLPKNAPIVVCGMGGSHLGARLLSLDPSCPPFYIHSDYGLPKLPQVWASTALYVASSYSGDTEETLDAARQIHAKGLPLAAIASGGALIEFAQKENLPYIQLPREPMEPRMAVGFSMLAFARLIGSAALEEAVRTAGRTASLTNAKLRGAELAGLIDGTVPFFYASAQNLPIAYHVKASINETGKIPASFNVIPELCHNELSSYTAKSKAVLPVFLDDAADDSRVKNRMRLIREMLAEYEVPTATFSIQGTSPLHKALSMVLIGNYAGAVIAEKLGVPDAATPMIGDFKRRLAQL